MLDPFANTNSTPLISVTGLINSLHNVEHRIETLRTENPQMSLAGHYYEVGRLYLTLGDAEAAVRSLTYETPPGTLADLMRVSLCQALCATGRYTLAKLELDRLLSESPRASRHYAVCLLTLGLYMRDQGRFTEAADPLNQALAMFTAEKMVYHTAACQLALVDVALRNRRLDEASMLLLRADETLSNARIHWYRPAWWALKARTALEQALYKHAATFAGRGLGAVDNFGDLSALPALYRVLAAALERGHERERVEDARDARLRAVTVARVRGSRLELARALFELGWHYKLFTNRPTLRARGSGFLFEAEQIFGEIGIPTPKHSGSAMPLL